MSSDQHNKQRNSRTVPSSMEPVTDDSTSPWRWNKAGVPIIRGLATWEWEVATGKCRFSPEWFAMVGSEPGRGASGAGLDREDSLYWWKRIHPDDVAELQDRIHDILEGRNDLLDASFRLNTRDGRWIWLFCRGTVIQKKDGLPTYVYGALLDVSRLRSDAKFQQGAQGVGDSLYHAMLENSPDMYVRLDRELFPLYMNPVVERYLGRKREDFRYIESMDELRIDPEQVEYLRCHVDAVFEEGKVIREIASFSTPTGEIVTGEYSFWPEFSPEGAVVSALTHFRDVTEQSRSEALSQLNSERLSALYHLTQMEQAPAGDVLAFVMQSSLRLTGSKSAFIFVPDGDIDGKGHMLWSDDHYDFLSTDVLPKDYLPDDLFRLTIGADGKRNYRSMINGDGVTPIQYSFGNMAVMRSLIAPGMDGDRIACLAGVCNKDSDYEESDLQQLETFISGAWHILHNRRYMEELQAAKEAAEAASKVKDAFLATVSHELRTPLNGLLSMLQLLKDTRLGLLQKNYVDTAMYSGESLLRIISDILEFSRMESEKMVLRFALFNFRETVLSTMDLFSSAMQEKDLKFASDLDASIPKFVVGDEARVRQILYNLISNSLKFTDRGTITITASLLPRAPKGKIGLYLSVADTGIGIAQEKLDSIFEPFTQVDSSISRRYGGTGLGLGIVKRLVELLGGGLTVESEAGAGTTIHCSLQLLPDDREMGEKDLLDAISEDVSPALDILVAEDDSVGRFALCSFLQKLGHRPVCVNDGKQALEALQLHKFHCLFTDIQMPEMDGLELAASIRSGKVEGAQPREYVRAAVRSVFSGELPEQGLPINKDIYIIAVSAHAMAGDEERFLHQGINFYISKPIVLQKLKDVLREVAKKELQGW